ncbi:hypothetical protein FQN54_006122 [Arachnomyces sp. PD_36]|nr:hypothetical protein FQN54_006122 [Arachnomyces sp. PD_36]
MPLLALPDELLYCIAEELEHEKSIYAFCRANRRLHNLLIIHLYRHNIRHSKSSALRWAVEKGHLATVQMLIEEGADVQCAGGKERTPLVRAAIAGHAEVVELLLSTGKVDPNTKGKDEEILATPLWWAAYHGHERVVRLLLGLDVVDLSSVAYDVDDEEDFGTCLGAAAVTGKAEVARALLETGRVDPDSRYGLDMTPLHLAAVMGSKEVAQLLRATGRVDIEAKTTDGDEYTPLHFAAREGQPEMVRFLLEEGAQVDSRCSNGSTPLILSSSEGQYEATKALIERGASIEEENGDLQPAIHVALRRKHLNIVQLLLDSGAPIDSPGTEKRWTPLHHAAHLGLVDMIDMLLERGARTDVLDSTGCLALHRAAHSRQIESLQLLIKRGAVIDGKSTCGRTALTHALQSEKPEVVQTLLDNGAVIHSSKEFQAILQMAAWRGNLDLIRPLGRTNNHAHEDYFTDALYLACIMDHPDVIEHLMHAGADADKADHHGWRAWGAVFGSGNPRHDVSWVLKKFGPTLYDWSIWPKEPTSWNVLDKPDCFTLDEDNRTVTYNRGTGKPETAGHFSIRADHPIPLKPSSTSFFEVEILNAGDTGEIAIGLCHEYTPLDDLPGRSLSSWGYHAKDGKYLPPQGVDPSKVRLSGPKYGTGDKIKCRIDADRRGLLRFYKNGREEGN